MSLSDARRKLESITVDFANKRNLRVVGENLHSKNTGEFIEVSVLPIEPYISTLTSQTESAIFQANFHLNEGGGIKSADDLVDDFMSLFGFGMKLGEVLIYKPTSRSQSFKSNSKLVIAVSIYFQFSNKI